MSVVTVKPGALIRLDPHDIKTVEWDWDEMNLAEGAAIATPTFTITPLVQVGEGLLTKDNEGVVAESGNRKSVCRLDATAAAEGDLYELEGRILTDESPAQTKNYSIRVRIATTGG